MSLASQAQSSAHVAPQGPPPQKELLTEKPPESSMTLEKLLLNRSDVREYLEIGLTPMAYGGWGVLRFRIAPACK